MTNEQPKGNQGSEEEVSAVGHKMSPAERIASEERSKCLERLNYIAAESGISFSPEEKKIFIDSARILEEVEGYIGIKSFIFRNKKVEYNRFHGPATVDGQEVSGRTSIELDKRFRELVIEAHHIKILDQAKEKDSESMMKEAIERAEKGRRRQ